MKAFTLLMVLILVGFLMFAASDNNGSGSVNREIVAACDNGRINANRILSFWQEKRVIRRISPISEHPHSATVYVNDHLWKAAGHDVQVSIGIAAYCRIKAANGDGYAVITLYHDGTDFASVTGGNYFRN